MATPAIRRVVARQRFWFSASHDAQLPSSLIWTRRSGNGIRIACRGDPSWRGRGCTRSFHVASFWMPPLIFTGLFIALWCWKCTMLVLFQNMIIYNPFLPPNARSMTIAEFARQCGGIAWREERIKSLDGTELGLCVADVSSACDAHRNGAPKTAAYILYFQGNASSLPPRLPDISWILRRLRDSTETPVEYTIVCLSYRGFWTSHDRPSERGIDMDAQAALQWISKVHQTRSLETDVGKPIVILWGQSIGCGFATNLAAKADCPPDLQIDGLVLETPFLSTREMLQALYPQKWLPYQYLHPFLWNHLNSWDNLGTIARKAKHGRVPAVYMVEAGKDELVPAHHAEGLHKRCQDVGLPVEWRKVRGALHNEAMVRPAGKQALAQSLHSAVTRAQSLALPQVLESKPKEDGRGNG